MKNYLVCTIKPWHLQAYEKYAVEPYWNIITSKEHLSLDVVKKLNPRYIFFPHWSWRVPNEITENYECICFHSSDVPYGRGGSPIQNLIVRGHKITYMSALRMVETLDAGPVYLKHLLSLEGRAQEIYERSAEIISDMIQEIVRSEPKAVEQVGESVIFDRRHEEESVLPQEDHLEQLYDHIRMLDADTYPRSFLIHGQFKLEFSNAKLVNDELIAQVKISRREKCQNE